MITGSGATLTIYRATMPLASCEITITHHEPMRAPFEAEYSGSFPVVWDAPGFPSLAEYFAALAELRWFGFIARQFRRNAGGAFAAMMRPVGEN